MSAKTASKCEAKIGNFMGEIGEFTIMVGDFNTCLSINDRTSKQKTSEYMVDLNSAVN